MDAMTPRERFHALMHFEPFDRLPIMEWAVWWDKTINRWHEEKLPKDITDRYAICEHFGVELYKQGGFASLAPGHPAPEAHGGAIIRDEADYEKYRHCFLPEPAVDKEMWTQWKKEQEEGKAVLWFTLEGFFWYPRILFGIEPHMFAFYEQPDLMHRINEDLAAWQLRVIEKLCDVCVPDFMTFAEDMSYNHGPMLSKDLFDTFMLPYYNKVIPALRERGILPIVDSDGDITTAAPWFEEAGLAGILPLERQAGVDVAVLRNNHPRMNFIGCFDKMTMPKGEAAMRAEFERLLPTAGQGGLIISCDHQTPPGVSYDEYQLYLRLFREYAEKAGALSRGEG